MNQQFNFIGALKTSTSWMIILLNENYFRAFENVCILHTHYIRIQLKWIKSIFAEREKASEERAPNEFYVIIMMMMMDINMKHISRYESRKQLESERLIAENC